MRKVRAVSKKYYGSLRDEYETYLYSESDKTIILFSHPGLSYWVHRKGARFEGPGGLLEIYFKHRWYNVWHIAEQISYLNLIYVNIALPATLQANVVEWTDLDLKYRVHPDHSVERLDQAEFEQNVQRMDTRPTPLSKSKRLVEKSKRVSPSGSFRLIMSGRLYCIVGLRLSGVFGRF